MTNDATDHDGELPTEGAAGAPAGCTRRSWPAASLGAGAIHAAATASTPSTPRSPACSWPSPRRNWRRGVMLVKGGRAAAGATALVNAGAVAAWASRGSGDLVDRRARAAGAPSSPTPRAPPGPWRSPPRWSRWCVGPTDRPDPLGVPAVALGALTVVAMMYGGTHVHSHDEGTPPVAAGASTLMTTRRSQATPTPRTPPPARRRPKRPRPRRRRRRRRGRGHEGHAHDTCPSLPTTTPSPTTPRRVGARVSAALVLRASRSTSPGETGGAASGGARRGLNAPRWRSCPQVRRRHGPSRARLPLDRRRRHRLRAIHEHRLHPDDHFLDPTIRVVVYRVDGTAHSCRRCNRQGHSRSTNLRSFDYGGPLMQWHVDRNLCRAINEEGIPTSAAVTTTPGVPGRIGQRRRREPDGPCVGRAPRAVRSPLSKVTGRAGRRGGGRPSTSARRATTTATSSQEGTRRRCPRPHQADPPLRRRRRYPRQGLRRDSSPRCRALPQCPIRPWPGRRVPLDRRRRHGPRALHPVGLDQERRLARPGCCRESCLRTQPDGFKKLVSAMYMLPADLAAGRGARLRREVDAVAHPRRPLLHRRPGGAEVAGLTDPDGTCSPPLVKRSSRR